KQRDVIKTIKKYAKENSLELTITEGGNHTKIKLGDKTAPIPRHREIGNTITKEIYKQLGIK
ncbi:toxin HicA, partial [Corynebacterium belfantii]